MKLYGNTRIATEPDRASREDRNELADESCDNCFFGQSGLCSLPKDEGCSTFRYQKRQLSGAELFTSLHL